MGASSSQNQSNSSPDVTECEKILEGNKLFALAKNKALAPVLRKARFEEAILAYGKALERAYNDGEIASAMKNIALANWNLANLLISRGEEISDIKSRFKDALRYFSKSYSRAVTKKCKTPNWQTSLTKSFRECTEDAFAAHDKSDDLGFDQKISSYEEYVYLIEHEDILAEKWLAIGKMYFHESIRKLTDLDFKKCLRYLHECHRPMEEAARAGKSQKQIMKAVRILREDVRLNTCTAESRQAIAIGDELYVKYDLENGETTWSGSLDVQQISEEQQEQKQSNEEMESKDGYDPSVGAMIWEVLDWYKKAVLLTKECDIEVEAIAISRIGRVYDEVLNMKARARDNFVKAIQLALSLHPKTFTGVEWFEECTEALKRYQREQVEQEDLKWNSERQKYVEELKDELKELEIRAKRDDVEFLEFLYKKHPPINSDHKLPKKKPNVSDGEEIFRNDLKRVLLKAITHYHPDRCNVKKLGEKRKVLNEEITKMLTSRYEKLK